MSPASHPAGDQGAPEPGGAQVADWIAELAADKLAIDVVALDLHAASVALSQLSYGPRTPHRSRPPAHVPFAGPRVERSFDGGAEHRHAAGVATGWASISGISRPRGLHAA